MAKKFCQTYEIVLLKNNIIRVGMRKLVSVIKTSKQIHWLDMDFFLDENSFGQIPNFQYWDKELSIFFKCDDISPLGSKIVMNISFNEKKFITMMKIYSCDELLNQLLKFVTLMKINYFDRFFVFIKIHHSDKIYHFDDWLIYLCDEIYHFDYWWGFDSD